MITTLDTTGLTESEIEAVCVAIRHHGDASHPWPDATTIRGFGRDYALRCLRTMAAEAGMTERGRALAALADSALDKIEGAARPRDPAALHPVYLEILAAMQAADEMGGPEGDAYIAVMNAVADEARRRRDTCRLNMDLPAFYEVAAREAIETLLALGIDAAWDYPGYIAVYLHDGNQLTYGHEDGEWYGCLQTTAGDSKADIPPLPGDATPGQIAAVLINAYGEYTPLERSDSAPAEVAS